MEILLATRFAFAAVIVRPISGQDSAADPDAHSHITDIYIEVCETQLLIFKTSLMPKLLRRPPRRYWSGRSSRGTKHTDEAPSPSSTRPSLQPGSEDPLWIQNVFQNQKYKNTTSERSHLDIKARQNKIKNQVQLTTYISPNTCYPLQVEKFLKKASQIVS